ncbi:MAG TPA: tetratricopeptide repeat protein [Opitutaceae bacterium]|nr:tetratricopeptide repeat protein [Opitutaceae bacterium]
MNPTRHSPTVAPETFSALEVIRARAAAGRLRPWGAAIAAVVVLIANQAVLRFDWLVFDDDINVFFNPHLGGLNGESVTWAFSNLDYVRRYLPLGWLGFDALIAVDGYNASVFHAASWLLSGLNAALAFLIGYALLPGVGPVHSPRIAWQRSGVALFGALVWSLHPLRAETAGWISGLLYLASTTCAGFAILLHLHGARTGAMANRGPLRILAALCYLASVLVYPVFLALPAVLTWLAVVRKGRSHLVAEIRSLSTWWLAAAFALGMNFFAQATASGPFPGFTALENFGLIPRAIAAVRTYLFYLAHTAWPETTSVFLGRIDGLMEIGHAKWVLAILLPAGLGAFLWKKTRSRATAYAVAALLSLAPFLGAMDPHFTVSDRYTVLWLGILACALGEVLISPAGRILEIAKYFAAGVVLVACVAAYGPALAPWQNTATLQKRIDEVNAAKPDVVMNYARPATALWWMGQREEAVQRLREGFAKFPDSIHLRAVQQELAETDTRWRGLVGNRTSIAPMAVMHHNLGQAWMQRGHPASAAPHFKRAFQLAPEFAEAAAGLVAATAPPGSPRDSKPK